MLFERDASDAANRLRRVLRAWPSAPEEKEIVVETEAQALKDLTAVPIYFASSYSLVKPYVSGFDSNVLDAPALKKTRLDTNWTHP